MNVTPQSSTTAYQACLEEALRQAPVFTKRWFTTLAGVLLEKSTSNSGAFEKRKIHEAWVELTRHQAAIENDFPVTLARAVTEESASTAVVKTDPAMRSLSSLRFGDLELMGDAQVQETIDEARLQQVFLLASDAGLTGFAARLSAAQGFKTVKADKNPLRPQVIARALANVLQALPLELDVRARWLTYGGQLMGNELQSLYQLLDAMLEKAGIQPAAYAVTASSNEASREGRSERQSDKLQNSNANANTNTNPVSLKGGQHGGIYLSREKLLTLDHLHHLMSGDYDDSFGSAASGVSGSSLPGMSGGKAQLPGLRRRASSSMVAALDALAALEKNGSHSQRGKSAGLTPPLPVALLREQLKTDSRSLGQSLAIEVVGLMIEQLSADPRLLAPIRQLIANAEPAFLRMGITEPRFFSDKNHPARRLLEAITAKSLAFTSESTPGFEEFMQDLQLVAGGLSGVASNNEQHFETLLDDFELRRAQRDLVATKAQQQAVQALLQAEQRNLLAEKIAAEIRQRPDFPKNNPTIAAFATGPWAQVMAKERLLGKHGGLGQAKAAFSLALGELFWSVDFSQTSRHRKRLVKIIPDMLRNMRNGLASIDYPLVQSKGFFDDLMRLHELALSASPVRAVVRKSSHIKLERDFAAGDVARDSQPWLDPTEARDSGFMDFVDSLADAEMESQPRFEATMPQDPSMPEAEHNVANEPEPDTSGPLRLGAWVELVSSNAWVRAQLTWISPHNTLFMFTSAGARSHSMTTRMLEQLLAQGRFKVISQQGVLEGAFDSIARAAVRNSVQG